MTQRNEATVAVRLPKVHAASKLSATKRKKKLKLLLLVLPFVLLVWAMSYVPLFGWAYAFSDYKPGMKFAQLHFVGLKYFNMIFSDGGAFFSAFRNTVVLSCLAIAVTPLPMVLAIMISELRSDRFKRLIQTITSFPNFISWILMYSTIFSICASSDSAMNVLLMNLGLADKPINLLGNEFNPWIVQTCLGLYKGLGYAAIIYIAAIAGISPEFYDAAEVDGAGKLARIWYITIPHLMPTFFVLLLLQMANFLNNGFEQFFIFQTPLTVDKLEVLDTLTYRIGMQLGQYSYSTAVGVFKSVVSIALLMFSNSAAKRIRGEPII